MFPSTKVRRTARYVKRKTKSRAVAPVIATLLLVAIAVVGGTIIFVFSQSFFNTTQISGMLTIESVRILGYDARDVSQLRAHNDVIIDKPNSGGDGDGINEQHERIAVYVKNNSVGSIIISELRFGGTVYQYANANELEIVGPASSIPGGQYDVLLDTFESNDIMLGEPVCVLEGGQDVTFIIALDNAMKAGRDTQFRLATTNGGIFVGTVVVGQQVG